MSVTSTLTISPSRNGLSDGMPWQTTCLTEGQVAVIHAELEHCAIDVLGRHARLDLADKQVQAFGGKPPGLAHAFESGRAVNLDLPGFAQRRTGCIDVGHGVPECLRGSARNVSIGVRSASNLKGER